MNWWIWDDQIVRNDKLGKTVHRSIAYAGFWFAEDWDQTILHVSVMVTSMIQVAVLETLGNYISRIHRRQYL